MALSVLFSTSQVVGAPSNIVITDQTTGSDVTAVTRVIFLTNASGQYLNENFVISSTPVSISWPIADGNTKTLINVLSADAALEVTLEYLNSGGSIVAEDSILSGFTLYNETFYYSLTQAQASQNQPPPMIIQDSSYFSNKLILRTLIDSGNNAISLGSDITSAQNCYSLASYLVLNENDFF